MDAILIARVMRKMFVVYFCLGLCPEDVRETLVLRYYFGTMYLPRQGNRGQDFDSRVRVFEALRYWGNTETSFLGYQVNNSFWVSYKRYCTILSIIDFSLKHLVKLAPLSFDEHQSDSFKCHNQAMLPPKDKQVVTSALSRNTWRRNTHAEHPIAVFNLKLIISIEVVIFEKEFQPRLVVQHSL